MKVHGPTSKPCKSSFFGTRKSLMSTRKIALVRELRPAQGTVTVERTTPDMWLEENRLASRGARYPAFARPKLISVSDLV